MNNQIKTLDFNGTELDVIEHDGQLWLTAEQVGCCLGYAPETVRQSVIVLYNRNADEFTDFDTCVIKLISQGQARDVRMFSSTGCNLLGFFANTARAKDFRVWAKTVLAGQPVVMAPAPAPATGAGVDAKLDRVLDLMEQTLRAIHKVIEAVHPAPRKPARRRMHVEDMDRITALRAKGYTLDELVAETDFSQSQCWAVCVGRVKVLESGRVSMDLRSDAARAADAAARAERLGPVGL